MKGCKYCPKIPPQNSTGKKGILLPEKGIFIFSCNYDPIYSRETNQIVAKEQEATNCLEMTK